MTAGSLVHGYVLHQRPYRDTSMLVEAFTADAGRIGLVAKGVRRGGRRLRVMPGPFQLLLLSWSGRGELHTLTAVEAVEGQLALQGKALFAAYYCNELILRLVERDSAEPAAFHAYDIALRALSATATAGPEAPLRRFELALLDALGYAPEIEHEAGTGEPVRGDEDYDFLPDSGPVPAAGDRPANGMVRVPGAHLRALARDEMDNPEVLRSARRVLASALEPLLGTRPLRTREVYRSLYGGSVDRSSH